MTSHTQSGRGSQGRVRAWVPQIHVSAKEENPEDPICMRWKPGEIKLRNRGQENGSPRGGVLTWGGGRRAFWGVGHVLNLDLAAGSMGVHTCGNSASRDPKTDCLSNTVLYMRVVEASQIFK